MHYGEFRLRLFRLIEKERKSMYYFFKQYIEDSKSMEELDSYLIKRFSINLDGFPFLVLLNETQFKKGSIDDFLATCFDDG